MMVETMGRADTLREITVNLLYVRQFHFHEQRIDCEDLLGKFIKPSKFNLCSAVSRMNGVYRL